MGAPRILVVEDEFLLASSLEEELRSFGYEVVGPFNSLSAATEGARRQPFDAAVLDVNLSGVMVYPLADELLARGVPMVFLSGYGFSIIPARFRGQAQLAKPSDPAALHRELRRALGSRGG